MTRGICEYCGKHTKLTSHHTKYRDGTKVYYMYEGNRIYIIQKLCRPCHDIVEKDYILKWITPSIDSLLYENAERYIASKTKGRYKSIMNLINGLYKRALTKEDHSREVLLIVELSHKLKYSRAKNCYTCGNEL